MPFIQLLHVTMQFRLSLHFKSALRFHPLGCTLLALAFVSRYTFSFFTNSLKRAYFFVKLYCLIYFFQIWPPRSFKRGLFLKVNLKVSDFFRYFFINSPLTFFIYTSIFFTSINRLKRAAFFRLINCIA